MAKKSPSPITEVATFVRNLAVEPFVYGQSDCCMALANWWQAVRGIDPAPHLRGTYDDEQSCDRVIREAGGVLNIVQGIADNVGARETDTPGPGDCAVVEFLGRQWGAIMTPAGRWAIKIGENRFAALRTCNVLRAWRV